MIIDLPTECNLSAITVTNIYKSFTYKMAAKINWHRYGTIITSLSSYVWGTKRCRKLFLKWHGKFISFKLQRALLVIFQTITVSASAV